jgi:hypothetical protein
LDDLPGTHAGRHSRWTGDEIPEGARRLHPEKTTGPAPTSPAE